VGGLSVVEVKDPIVSLQDFFQTKTGGSLAGVGFHPSRVLTAMTASIHSRRSETILTAFFVFWLPNAGEIAYPNQGLASGTVREHTV
jgi:hypothetical protein